MGKGDKKRAQRKIDEQQKISQGYLSGVQGNLAGQQSNYNNLLWGSPSTGGQRTGSGRSSGNPQLDAILKGVDPNNWQQGLLAVEPQLRALGMNLQRTSGGLQNPNDPSGIRGRIYTGQGYDNYFDPFESYGWNTSGGGGIMGQTMGDYGNIISRYGQFADTGGYSEQDKANIRARAVSPIRAMYERGTQNLSRQRALQGGYSPGYTTALTRMNRDFGQNASDATTNAEAAIAQMVHQGKLAGMGGMAGMYGATPGLASTFGNQALTASGQQLSAADAQNNLAKLLISGQIEQGNMKGFPWSSVLGGIGAAIPYMGPIAKGIGGLFKNSPVYHGPGDLSGWG